MSLQAGEGLRRGSTYDVVSQVSEARDTALRAAGTEYEPWLVDRYRDGPCRRFPAVKTSPRVVAKLTRRTHTMRQWRSRTIYATTISTSTARPRAATTR